MSFEPDVSAPEDLCVICNEGAAIHYTSGITNHICPKQAMMKLFGADCVEREDLRKKIYEHVTLYRSQFLPDFTIHCVHRNKFDMFEILLSHDHENYGRLLDTFFYMMERKPEYPRFFIALFKKFHGRFKPNVYGDLYWLVMASKISMPLLRWVAVQGLNLNATNYLGETILHYAITFDRLDLLKESLQLGVDPTICSYVGTSPFMASLKLSRPKMSTLLVQYLVCEDEDSCVETWCQVFMADSLIAYDLVKKCKHISFKVWEDGKPCNIIDKFLSSPARYRVSLFKAIWNRIDHDKAYASMIQTTVIQEAIFYSGRALYPTLLTIIHSDKLPKVVRHGRRIREFNEFQDSFMYLKPVFLEPTFTVGVMVAVLALNGVPANNVEKVVVPLLKAGHRLVHSDLEFILAIYKYGDLFEKVFAFGCEYRGRLGVTNNAWAQHIVHVANSLYWTKRTPYAWEKRTLSPYFAFGKKVPSLREVARNASRKFICEHYNVLTALMYYEVLQSLELPKVIRDILMLKVPLYAV